MFKKILAAIALGILPPVMALAQTAPIFPAQIVSAAAPLAPESWIKLGKNFGNRGQWQFGFDKSATADACAAYAVRANQILGGVCRDLLILAQDGAPVFHAGGSILYGAASKPNYVGRLGFNVGPLGSAGLNYVADHLPYLEAAASLSAPAWAAYVGKITTVDYMVGNINGQLDHGPQLKVSLPLADLRALIPGA